MLCQRWKFAFGHLPGYANGDSMRMATVTLHPHFPDGTDVCYWPILLQKSMAIQVIAAL
jgi:hypothetical protein